MIRADSVSESKGLDARGESPKHPKDLALMYRSQCIDQIILFLYFFTSDNLVIGLSTQAYHFISIIFNTPVVN